MINWENNRGAKSKHVTMPYWMWVRAHNVAEQLGCPFSKLVQSALREKLPQWEEELGDFQVDPLQRYEDQ